MIIKCPVCYTEIEADEKEDMVTCPDCGGYFSVEWARSYEGFVNEELLRRLVGIFFE